MTPERWQQIREVLHAAMQLEEKERAAFLERQCSGDAELRQEVDKLLAAERKVRTDFLESPALAQVAMDQSAIVDAATHGLASESSSLIGRRVGSYRIVEAIGHGGMGVVYRAFRADDEYRKQVAIKVVQHGQDSDAVVERFKNERQILASLDHPNIARLLDGGTTELGEPYFVMELIEGLPLDRHCDRSQLTIPERLALFRQVCSAVQYAHRYLIVHRDIKPGNILVTADGVPKLLDFGIAKILEATETGGQQETTITLHRALTPGYASPEQVTGATITTASDVYSLGVVVYELLTGRSPYRLTSRAPHEIARQVCEVEPERPSVVAVWCSPARPHGSQPPALSAAEAAETRRSSPEKLSRELRGDLDDIVMMALRKEPQRRYASAEQLAEDIRRYLQKLPVSASKDTVRYRTSKFIRRHKAGVAMAVAIAVTVITGLVVTLYEAHVARQQQARAERRFNDVRKLANALLFDIHDNISDLPGATGARKVLVDHAREYLESLSRESSDDPGLQRELAAAYERLGDVQRMPFSAGVGDSHGALDSYNQAVELMEKVEQSKAVTDADRLQLAGAHDKLTFLLAAMGDLRGAIAHGSRAVGLLTAVTQTGGSESENAKQKLARALVDWGDVYWDAGAGFAGLADPQVALRYYEQANDLTTESLNKKPTDPSALRRRAVIRERTARALGLMDRRKEALSNLYSAASIFESLATGSANYRAQKNVAANDTVIADVLAKDGRCPEALRYARKYLAIYKTLSEHDPNDVASLEALAGTYSDQGRCLAQTGQMQSGLRLIQKAISIDQQRLSHDPAYVPSKNTLAIDRNREADVLLRMGKRAEALKSYIKARELYGAVTQTNSQDVDAQLNFSATEAKVAGMLLELGQIDEARATLARVVESSEKLHSLSSEQVRYTLAEGYAGLGDVASYLATHAKQRQRKVAYWTEAASWYQKSIATWNELHSPGSIGPKGFVPPDPREIQNQLRHCRTMLKWGEKGSTPSERVSSMRRYSPS